MTVVDAPHEQERRWADSLERVAPLLKRSTQAAISQGLNELASRSDAHARSVTCALLCRMVHESQSCEPLFQQLCCCARDGLQLALSEMVSLVLWRYQRLPPTSKPQVLALLSLFIGARVPGTEQLAVALLRRVGTGCTSDADLWLGDNVLSLLVHHREWLFDAPDLVPAAMLTYLRLATGHPEATMRDRRERELRFCQLLWTERREACLKLGRDLVLALHPFRDAAALAPLWAEAHGTASRGGHGSHGGRLGPMGAPARPRDLLARVSPEAERCVRFMLGELRVGEQGRHLGWFAQRHLERGGVGTLQDLLRNRRVTAM